MNFPYVVLTTEQWLTVKLCLMNVLTEKEGILSPKEFQDISEIIDEINESLFPRERQV